ncbi:hypothetical protein EGR_04328 [Echinococcus granulosus]|uniref:Uncharacterized protein n=1 Tax=Echinococcus granulosus TaxID=6210 RepID=W6V467_ECHGR|nr:hypothetical protein EGR_04328 [Echinococcus granulosus]EUB60889.1 hypothetical protein EGR_04328 [Echinococcus granulosus]
MNWIVNEKSKNFIISFSNTSKLSLNDAKEEIMYYEIGKDFKALIYIRFTVRRIKLAIVPHTLPFLTIWKYKNEADFYRRKYKVTTAASSFKIKEYILAKELTGFFTPESPLNPKCYLKNRLCNFAKQKIWSSLLTLNLQDMFGTTYLELLIKVFTNYCIWKQRSVHEIKQLAWKRQHIVVTSLVDRNNFPQERIKAFA